MDEKEAILQISEQVVNSMEPKPYREAYTKEEIIDDLLLLTECPRCVEQFAWDRQHSDIVEHRSIVHFIFVQLAQPQFSAKLAAHIDGRHGLGYHLFLLEPECWRSQANCSTHRGHSVRRRRTWSRLMWTSWKRRWNANSPNQWTVKLKHTVNSPLVLLSSGSNIPDCNCAAASGAFWLILLVIFGILLADYRILAYSGIEFAQWMQIAMTMVTIVPKYFNHFIFALDAVALRKYTAVTILVVLLP